MTTRQKLIESRLDKLEQYVAEGWSFSIAKAKAGIPLSFEKQIKYHDRFKKIREAYQSTPGANQWSKRMSMCHAQG